MIASPLAQFRVRLHAWWEGVDPAQLVHPAPAMAQDAPALVLSEPAQPHHLEEPQPEGGEELLIEQQRLIPAEAEADDEPDYEPPIPLSPRMAALRYLWGGWRIAPQEPKLLNGVLASLKLPPRDPVCFVGPGGMSPVIGLAKLHSGPLEVCEWREEAFAPMHAAAGAIEDRMIMVGPMGLDGRGLPRGLAALISLEELAYVPDLDGYINAVLGGLRGDGRAVLEGYCSTDGALEVAPCFSTSFAQPMLRTRETVRLALALSGAVIEHEEDRTREHVHAARSAFRRFSRNLAERRNQLPPGGAQELMAEAESWQARMNCLSEGKIRRMRFVIRKRKPKTFKPPPKKKEWRRGK